MQVYVSIQIGHLTQCSLGNFTSLGLNLFRCMRNYQLSLQFIWAAKNLRVMWPKNLICGSSCLLSGFCHNACRLYLYIHKCYWCNFPLSWYSRKSQQATSMHVPHLKRRYHLEHILWKVNTRKALAYLIQMLYFEKSLMLHVC